MADAEIIAEARRKSEALQLVEPDLHLNTDDAWLEIARQLEDAHEGLVIVNPRNLRATSLLDIDRQWLADMKTWRDEVQFWLDYPKRPSGMK